MSTLPLLIALVLATPPTAEELRQQADKLLSPLSGTLKLAGLREPVEVIRDRWGVPHIYARNRDDLFFAQGFVAAQDRLFQLDLWRRTGAGEMAEIVGPLAVPADTFARLTRYRGDPDAEWAAYGPEAKAIITAFTRGINAWIEQCGDRLPIEFSLLNSRPKPWQPDDVLLRMSGLTMTQNFREELLRAELLAAVGPENARRIAPTDPPLPYAPAAGLDLTGIGRDALAGFRAATALPRFDDTQSGSNNWAVSGARSLSGKPLLAGDPHRALGLPSLRYLVHLNAPGWNVIGAGEPALPGVALGHNDHVAWAITIVCTDQADVYVEDLHPDDPDRYRVGDDWQPVTVVKEQIPVRGGPAVPVELRFTRHGPIIHRDLERRRALSLRWVGQEPGAAAYLNGLSLAKTRNAAEFREALNRWKVPSLNMVYADTEGTIGWLPAGAVPVREAGDGLLPVPGRGGYEWTGFRTLDDRPQIVNPPDHVVMTANHNTTPPGYTKPLSYDWTPPYRAQRLQELLGGPRKFAAADFAAMQHDSVSIPGRVLANWLRDHPPGEPQLAEAVRILSAWDGHLARDSAAGAIYEAWLRQLLPAFYRQGGVPMALLEDLTRSRNAMPVLLREVQTPSEAWFGPDPTQARDRLIAETLTAALASLPADRATWSWGRLHQAAFRHPLSHRGPAYAEVFDPPAVSQAGDGFSPNATSVGPNYAQVSGATYRQVFDLADWDRGLATSAPGQSGQPGSPHYADLLALWGRDQHFPLVFSRGKVEEMAGQRLELQPATGP